jgi:WhiB family transcriptional regulator, redox-sensing transcriptional regulator
MNRNTISTGNTAVRVLASAYPGFAAAELGEWTEQALCAETDPEIFFPPTGDPAGEARQICGWCRVRQDCLDYALGAPEEYGIWGGLDPDERRKLRRQLREAKTKTRKTRGAA